MSDHFVRHILNSGYRVETEFDCRAMPGADCRSACACYGRECESCECDGSTPKVDKGTCLQLPFLTEDASEEFYDGIKQPIRGPDWQPITMSWEGYFYTWDYEVSA